MEKLGGVTENLENLASSAASGKSGGSCKAENLENLTRKIWRKNSLTGKSGKSNSGKIDGIAWKI